jgi:SAM-dependent methyltransferase
MDGPSRNQPLRDAVGRFGHRTLRTLGAHSYLASVRAAWVGEFVRAAPAGALAAERGAVSTRLFQRLSAEDVEEVERRIQASDLAARYAAAAAAEDEVTRRRLLLSFGASLGAPHVEEKTGLGSAQPPAEVHAMARGPLAAAGGLYEADMVVDALASSGAEIASLATALDFGCSSGRVVRVLAAAYPELEWYGCDPNEPAIAWGRKHMPGVNLFVNDDAPPLELADASLDLVCAISIWSHFAPALGLRWFEEMHRLIRPGGRLVCTTHGLTSVASYATRKERTPDQSREIADALYSQGWWYLQEFGAAGDWGVVNPEWGSTFLSPEWMLTQLCPRWRVLEFAPGRNQDNQDVYVLQRV